MPRVRSIVIVLAFFFTCGLASSTAWARNRSYTAALQSLERDYHLKQKRPPGLWLARIVLKVAHPRGISKLDFAVFEDQDFRKLTAARDFDRRIQTTLEADWKRLVQMDAPGRQERVLLFAQLSRRHMEVFVFAVDGADAVALFARVKPELLQRLIDHPASVLPGR